MDEILLYLSLKNYGEWMSIYDSIQNREDIKAKDIENAISEVDCKFVTLINDNYVENLKTIFKPPFGIFCYGDYSLLQHNVVTVYADEEKDDAYINALRKAKLNLLWVDVSNNQMVKIINKWPNNNIFYLPEAKNLSNKTYQNILSNEDIIPYNAFVSEVWERKKNIDYSNQLEERVYLGLSKKVLVLTKLKSKQLLALADYANLENIRIIFLESVLDEKTKKMFGKDKIEIINNPDQIENLFANCN